MKFGKKNGYATYESKQGELQFTHRRVAEKKLGGPIAPGRHVHHINGRKTDNRPENLVVLDAGVHARVHHAEARGASACFCCGRTGHSVKDCYATTDYRGKKLNRKTKQSSRATTTTTKAGSGAARSTRKSSSARPVAGTKPPGSRSTSSGGGNAKPGSRTAGSTSRTANSGSRSKGSGARTAGSGSRSTRSRGRK